MRIFYNYFKSFVYMNLFLIFSFTSPILDLSKKSHTELHLNNKRKQSIENETLLTKILLL